jgi:transposase
MNLHSIGIDLGKTVFHLVGLNAAGEVVVRKKFSRIQLLRFTVNVVEHSVRIAKIVMSHLTGRYPELFILKEVPWYTPGDEEVPK